jgi:hypothetical protein
MSAIPKPADPEPIEKPREMTDEDWNALLQSRLWLWEQDVSAYHKQWVAVLGKRIIDADANKEELYRRLDALGDTIDQYKVLVRYIPGFDELYE